jgi:hypothetical protein
MFGVQRSTIHRAAFDIKPKRKPRRRRKRKMKGQRMMERTHCPQGHEYTPENTNILKKARSDGSIGHKRQCKACKKAWRPKSERLKAQRAQQGTAHAEG